MSVSETHLTTALHHASLAESAGAKLIQIMHGPSELPGDPPFILVMRVPDGKDSDVLAAIQASTETAGQITFYPPPTPPGP